MGWGRVTAAVEHPPCVVCRASAAPYDPVNDVYHPCWSCQQGGWKLRQQPQREPLWGAEVSVPVAFLRHLKALCERLATNGERVHGKVWGLVAFLPDEEEG